MSFDKQAPSWSAPGVEPPESKKQEGWQVNDKPPAAWLNWFMSLTAESLKELQDKAAEKAWVQEQIAAIDVDIQDASLTQKGIVQLSSATDGTRENVAATEKAVGQAFQAGNERKAEVVAALVAIGVSASTSETWAQLIPKITAVIRATGNATVADVIAGKTFSNATANGLTGNIPDRGTGGTVTPNTADQTKAAGRYTSAITIKGEPNLIAGNLPKDKTFFGITGLLERMTTAEKQAIANAITGKGVAASANDTNTVLAQKIGQIITGKRFVQGTVTPINSSTVEIPLSTFIPKVGVLWRGTGNGSFDQNALAMARTADDVSPNYGPILTIGTPNADGVAQTGFMNQNATGNGTVRFSKLNAIGYGVWNYLLVE
ncbi:hypothetical protein M2277_005368 [Paenibacillus sp. LBL]|uniref:phage tail protein n=1 Tax=Paenibacillus sp. LBL TaxID=2940563 RepID=UPI002476D160|nr:phage tail protein [Paenibacillus sp. LBL]MDH6674671.1 hypothetical protein [Paenibacillus sp. LBL]